MPYRLERRQVAAASVWAPGVGQAGNGKRGGTVVRTVSSQHREVGVTNGAVSLQTCLGLYAEHNGKR